MSTAESDQPILIESCRGSLLTRTPDELLEVSEKFSGLVARAYERQHPGKAIFQLEDCEAIDAGAIMLLMHAGYQLGNRSWQAFVSGEGEAMDLVVRHLDHYLREKSQRHTVGVKPGDYLLRKIEDKTAMVSEISDWAKTVQIETGANPRLVALWQFQISEVTTNGFQHGFAGLDKQPPILVAGKAEKASNTVQLAAMDHGHSIPKTIKELADSQNVEDGDGDRILFACAKGITAKTVPANQGAGLYSLVETVKSNKGKLMLLSGNGLVHVSSGRLHRRNLRPQIPTVPVLRGTLTIVNLSV